MSTIASAAATSTATQLVQDTPPIAKILPYLLSTLSFIWVVTSKLIYGGISLISYVTAPVIHLIEIPLPIVLYLLSPLITFCQVIVGVLFLFPYNILLGIFVAIQPVYVLCGVAGITGAVIGLCGRGVAGALSASVLGPGKLDFGTPLPTNKKKWVES